MVVSKTKIYITTKDTYQWFISAQKQVFIHVQYLAAFFIILLSEFCDQNKVNFL